MESEVQMPMENAFEGKEKLRKRRLELDEDCDDEANDTVIEFGEDGRSAPVRRGRKQGRRVSGVYREIKSLQNIGQNAVVMELIFDRMPIREVMAAGATCSMWCIVACRVFRKRLGHAPFTKLWTNSGSSEYLRISWELFYHEELLSGIQVDDAMGEEQNIPPVPRVQALFSIGSRHSYNQFTDEDAKLPFREDHIFAICQEAVVTAPDFSFVDTFDEKFGLDMAVQTLFMPQSQHFTVKAFVVESSKTEWSVEDVKWRLELSPEDIGAQQELRAVFITKYWDTDATRNFIQMVKMDPRSIGLVGGFCEELGCNRGGTEVVAAAGFSFYIGPEATATVYTIDFMKESSVELLLKMKAQRDSKRYGFCLLFYRDARPLVEMKDDDDDEAMDWSYNVKPEPMMGKILGQVKTYLPKTHVLGLNSLYPMNISCALDATNVDDQSRSSGFVFGLLLVTFN